MKNEGKKKSLDLPNEIDNALIRYLRSKANCEHYMVNSVSVNINKHGYQSVPSITYNNMRRELDYYRSTSHYQFWDKVRNDLYTLFGMMVGVAVFIITILVLAV